MRKKRKRKEKLNDKDGVRWAYIKEKESGLNLLKLMQTYNPQDFQI